MFQKFLNLFRHVSSPWAGTVGLSECFREFRFKGVAATEASSEELVVEHEESGIRRLDFFGRRPSLLNFIPRVVFSKRFLDPAQR
jgi:hypothetical protein